MRRPAIARFVASAALTIITFGTTGAASAAPVVAPVAMDAQLGVGGVVPTTARQVPLRVTLESPRSVTARLSVSGAAFPIRRNVELNAGVERHLDLVIAGPVDDLDIVVSVGTETSTRKIDVNTTDAVPALVGVDPALLSDRTETITIGGIQTAVLVPLVDDLWDRPGSIESMNGIVLGAAQADRLEARRLQRVRGWVWQGGNLALTGPRIDPLPVIGRPAEDGGRTAVGLGWVRFVGDAPEQARWSEAIEPVATRPSLQADGGGGWGFNDPSQGIGADLAWMPRSMLVDMDYLSWGVVAGSVFGTVLLVGPVLWLVLRTPRRRRYMWFLSPGLSLVVAVALVVGGQAALTSAEPRGIAVAESTPWGLIATAQARGVVASDPVVALPEGAELLASTGGIAVAESGSDRRAHFDVPINGVSAAALGPLTVGNGAQLDVTASAADGATVSVTVTNRSTDTVDNVSVSTAGVSTQVGNLAPGAKRTVGISLSSSLQAFATLWPSVPTCSRDDRLWGPCLTDTSIGAWSSPDRFGANSSGRIAARGMAERDVGGARTTIAIWSFAPIAAAPTPGGPVGAALRVDEVGWRAPAPLDGQLAGPAGADNGESVTRFVRISSPVDRPAGPCAVHSAIGPVEWFDGSSWTELASAGEAFADGRYLAPNEFKPYGFPAMAAGDTVWLRLHSNVEYSAPMAIDCEIGS